MVYKSLCFGSPVRIAEELTIGRWADMEDAEALTRMKLDEEASNLNHAVRISW
jgi:hypothetical protein